MKKLISTVLFLGIAVLLVYLVLPIVAIGIVFHNTTFEETNIEYPRVVTLLADLQPTYHFKYEVLKGAGPYSVYFDKGMDHLCVVRVDNAEGVIKYIETTIKSVHVMTSGMSCGTIVKWYYDEYEDSKYTKVFLDECNYYVLDKKNMVVWYIQYST